MIEQAARPLEPADRARLPDVVRVRAAVHLDHRGHPARDQRLEMAAFMVGYLFALAYIMAGITYWLAVARRPLGKGEYMAGSVNKVILVGNLGRDPESRSFQNGGKVVNLRIATSENLEGPQHRRAQGKDRMALGRDLQRRPRQRRRALSAQGQQGLYRGRAADPQMAGPVRATTDIRPRSCCRASTAC